MSSHSTVGVRELRQNLSVYLTRVKRGESLTVTERRQTVAVLRPVSRHDDVLSRLTTEGRAVAAQRSPQELPKPLRRRLKTPLSQVVDELREDTV